MSFTPLAADEVFSRQAMNERLGQVDIPAGIICMWSGAANAVPEGWALCDGANGTPDLRGRFVLGAGGSYGVGVKGGEETHTLSWWEMPEHTHGRYAGDGSGNNADAVQTESYHGVWDPNRVYTSEIGLTNEGGSQAHNNMPPYYALCYIMKL